MQAHARRGDHESRPEPGSARSDREEAPREHGCLEGNLETIGQGIQSKRPSDITPSAPKPDPALESWHTLVYRMIAEMDSARNDLHVVAEDLVAAKADAEYREVLVRAWPANHFVDRLTYLGAAVLGVGGAAYVLVGRDMSLFFWGVGGLLMAWGLYGMRNWEAKRWGFYADQFSVDAKYRSGRK